MACKEIDTDTRRVSCKIHCYKVQFAAKEAKGKTQKTQKAESAASRAAASKAAARRRCAANKDMGKGGIRDKYVQVSTVLLL